MITGTHLLNDDESIAYKRCWLDKWSCSHSALVVNLLGIRVQLLADDDRYIDMFLEAWEHLKREEE